MSPEDNAAEAAILRNIMTSLDRGLNGDARGADRKVGIVLLTFPFGVVDDARTNFISNGADRKDLVVMFRELAARLEGQPRIVGRA